MTVLPEEECLGAFVDLQQKRRPPRREIDFDPGMMMMRMFQPENGRDGFGQLAVPANGTVLPQPATMAVLIDRECQLRLDPGTLAAFKDLSIDDARVIESVQLTAGAEFGLGPEVLDVIRCAQLLAPACRAVKQAHYVKFNRTTQGTLQQGDPVPTMRLGRIRQRTRCRPAGRRARLCGGPSRCSIRRQPRTKGSRAAGRRLGRRAARGRWRGVAAAADRGARAVDRDRRVAGATVDVPPPAGAGLAEQVVVAEVVVEAVVDAGLVRGALGIVLPPDPGEPRAGRPDPQEEARKAPSPMPTSWSVWVAAGGAIGCGGAESS